MMTLCTSYFIKRMGQGAGQGGVCTSVVVGVIDQFTLIHLLYAHCYNVYRCTSDTSE